MITIVRRRKLGATSVKGIVAASKTGIDWCRNDLGIPQSDLYIRWGCTANLPDGAKVINKASAIHTVANKLEFRRTLEEAELCPATWFSYTNPAITDGLVANGIIIRTKVHSQGRGLWLVNSRVDLVARCKRLGEGEYYLAEYIRKVAEYRVFVMSGRALCVAEKTPANPEAIAWNVAKGGRFDNVRWDGWNVKVVKTAIKGFLLSGLDFGGVDVMVDADGDCTILEINSAPSLTSPYRQECMAKGFDYIINKGKDNIPLVDERGGYTKFIHPAVCDRARMVGG